MDYSLFKSLNDEALSKEILKYNSMESSDEKDDLYQKIYEKVDLLIYFIPLHEGFLSPEDIADFYIAQRPNIDDLISGYSISRYSFITFLREVLRKRALFFAIRRYRRESEKMLNDLAVATDYYADDSSWESIIDEKIENDESINDDDDDSDTFSFTGEYDEYTLSELSYHIIVEKSYREKRHLSRIEKKMREHLQDFKGRKDFIALLLYVPNDYLFHKSLSLSKMLSINEEALIKFLEKKEKYKGEEARKKMESSRDLAIKHHESVLKYSKEIVFSAISEEERKKKYETELRLRRQYLARIKQMQYYSKGLTQEQIGAILFLSRANVSLSVKNAKNNVIRAQIELEGQKKRSIIAKRI